MARYFSPEYKETLKSPRWFKVRRIAFGITLGRDVLFPLLPAQECDHLVYDRMGHELPFIDIVPLHKWTHFVVTWLRRWGMKTPVNFILRAAYAFWLVSWIYLILVAGQICGLWHGIPLPSPNNFHRIFLAINSEYILLKQALLGFQAELWRKH